MIFERPGRNVERIFLHCSASDEETLEGDALVGTIREWHLARGFQDVGYHFLIDKQGKIMKGRDIQMMPAAQKGHNAHTIAIMVHGLTGFTSESLNACHYLCKQINVAYKGRVSFHGHCEVSNKTCPVFNYKGLLNLDSWQRMP